MAVIFTKHGGMSVRNNNFVSGGGGGVSTRESPTPSASDLYGTAAQKEAQIAAFRSGGSAALESTKASQKAAEQRRIAEEARRIAAEKAAEQRRIAAEKARQARIDSGKIGGQVTSQTNQTSQSYISAEGTRVYTPGVDKYGNQSFFSKIKSFFKFQK